MIEYEVQIKIQAFLDGELPEAEAREIASLIARDEDAAALHVELKNTRRALAGAEEGVRVPETREFYWSRIGREIERVERLQPVKSQVSVWHVLARWLRPLGAIAAVAVAALLILHTDSNPAGDSAVVTAMSGADATTFRDEASGTTLVWFSYPAENGVANDAAPTTLN